MRKKAWRPMRAYSLSQSCILCLQAEIAFSSSCLLYSNLNSVTPQSKKICDEVNNSGSFQSRCGIYSCSVWSGYSESTEPKTKAQYKWLCLKLANPTSVHWHEPIKDGYSMKANFIQGHRGGFQARGPHLHFLVFLFFYQSKCPK